MRWKLLGGLVLAACAAAPRLVLTQKPHAYYAHKSRPELARKINSDLAYKGFDHLGGNDSLLRFEKHRMDYGSRVANDNNYDPRARDRMVFSLTDTAAGVDVKGAFLRIADPGTPLEKTIDLSLTAWGQDMQNYLDNLRLEFEMDTLGRIGVMVDSVGRILGITSRSGAFEAGLLAGDSILRIDGHPIPMGNPMAISRVIAGEPETRVEVEFMRLGEVRQVSVLRKRL